MTALILDDEKQSRTLIRQYLQNHFPQMITEEAATLAEAKKSIQYKSFDIIFLDINLGQGTSFDLLDKTTIQNNAGILHDPIVEPSGIFVTGGSAGPGNVVSKNQVHINLNNYTLSGNQNVDLMAYGAFTITNNLLGKTPPTSPIIGKFNIVQIQLNGMSVIANVTKKDCIPTETPKTNKVTITKMP